MRALIADAVDPQCARILAAAGLDVDDAPGLPAGELKRRIAGAGVLIVRSQTMVTAELLEAAKDLRVVGRAGAGVDNIDVSAATRRGVVVLNTPGGNTISTAEHTMSMMLALARNIPEAHRSVKSGAWDRKAFVGTEMQGKCLGILGLGKVGAEVAKRAAAFGMKILAYDPAQSPESAARVGAALVDLGTLAGESDILTVHSPLLPETRGLIGKDLLAKCRRGVRIINCARGGIVDERALLDALNSGHVAGAALDVFEHEPPGISELVRHPNVVVTPHLGASTEEAQEKVAVQIARQVVDLLQGREVAGSVNAEVLRLSMKAELRPWLELAEKLGQMLAQMNEGTIRSVSVTACGDLLADALPALGAAVVKGILRRMLDEPVNELNAPVIARERGISVNTHQRSVDETYSQVISAGCRSERRLTTFSGTVFGSSDIRLIGLDEYRCEIRPEGHLLLYLNIDRPGMLARVSDILARAGINIGGLSLGRLDRGSQALTIIAVDSPVAPGQLREIASVEGVSDVKTVSL